MVDELKDWQHGFDLDYLKQIETSYLHYNQFSVSPFSKYKKNDIARDLHEKALIIKDNYSYVWNKVKVPSSINLYGNVEIGRKLATDMVITKLIGTYEGIQVALDSFRYMNTWLYVWAEDIEWNSILNVNNFTYVGGKITTHGEIYSVWFRDTKTKTLFEDCELKRRHFDVDPVEMIGIKKVADVRKKTILDIAKVVSDLKLDFTNHYSNYNRDKAWSAISLRGYSNDWSFITKPIEMNDKWQQAHKNEDYFIQDTDIFNHFPMAYEMLQYFFDGPIHRVRFMKLKPGGGELQRHTDQVDPDAGNNLGQLARFHFPIITNPDMEFTSWTPQGDMIKTHMKVGEMWLLDTRKPHQAINNGTEDRTHLVVDAMVTPKIKEMILNA